MKSQGRSHFDETVFHRDQVNNNQSRLWWIIFNWTNEPTGLSGPPSALSAWSGSVGPKNNETFFYIEQSEVNLDKSIRKTFTPKLRL